MLTRRVVEKVARSAWDSETRSDIHWLNEPGPEQLALVHLAVRIRDLLREEL